MQSSNLVIRRFYRADARPVTEVATALPTRLQIGVCALLLLLSIALSIQGFQLYQVGAHYDDARYVMLAQSLIHTDNYGMIYLPGPPQTPYYPFGYPLLLAPIALLFPDNFNAWRALSLAATVISATLLFWGWPYFSRRSYWWAVAAVGLFGLAPLTIDLSRRVMSEPVFLMFALLALLLTERAARGQQGAWWYVWMSLTLIFVLFTRTIGVVLLLSVATYLFLHKGRQVFKDFVILGITTLVMLAIILSTTVIQVTDLWPSVYLRSGNASFLQFFTVNHLFGAADETQPEEPTSPETPEPTDPNHPTFITLVNWYLVEGLDWHIGNHYRKIIVPIGGDENSKEQAFANWLGFPSLPRVIGYLIFGLIVLGYIRWIIRENLSAFTLFALFYFGALLIWNWNDIRLLYPVQPQMQLAFLIGVEGFLLPIGAIVKKWTNGIATWSSPFLTFLVLCILAISFVKSFLIQDSRTHVGDVEVRTAWIKAHTDADAIIMTEAPEIDFIYSQRKVVPLTTWAFGSASDLEGYLSQNHVTYILMAPQILWQKKYEPSYSADTTKLRSLVADLASTGRLTQVYNSEDRLIQVLQYQPVVTPSSAP